MKMKKFFCLLISIMLIVSIIPMQALASTVTITPKDVLSASGEKIGVSIQIRGNTLEGAYEIPSTYEGYPVVEVSYAYLPKITSISIPASVENLGMYVFSGSRALSAITVAEDNAYFTAEDGVLFSKDKRVLTAYPAYKNSAGSYAIPSNVTTIKKVAFDGCQLSTLAIPAGLTKVEDLAFRYMPGITSFEVDAANTSFSAVDGVLFTSDMKSLVKYPSGKEAGTYNIPNGVTTICAGNFYGCYNIGTLNIPASVVTIGSQAFESAQMAVVVDSQNTAYTSVDGSLFTKDMSRYVYFYNNGAAEVVIPNGVKVISEQISSGNSNVEQVTFPEGVTEIQTYAFSWCDNLKTVYLPVSLKTVGWEAFVGAPMTDVYYAGNEEQWAQIAFEGGISSTVFSTANIHYGAQVPEDGTVEWTFENGVLTVNVEGRMPAYSQENRPPWFETCEDDVKKIVVTGNTERISPYAFSGLWQTKSVVIPEGVTNISAYAFEGCRNLSEIELPQSIQVISDDAFDSWIEEVYYRGTEAQWAEVDIQDFRFNNANPTVYYSQGLPVSTLEWAVSDNGEILTITGSGKMSACVDYTMPWADYSSTVKQVIIGGDFLDIADAAFYDFSALESVSIPESVVKIGASAFRYCSSLKTIHIPKNVVTLDSAFNYNSKLEAVTVDSENPSFVSVDGVLFTKDMKTLILYPAAKRDASYTVPNTVEYISNDAFSGCQTLSSVSFASDAAQSIGSGAFADCTNLTEVNLGDSITSINYNAFNGCSSMKTLTLPKSLEYLDYIIGGTAIKEITIPANTTGITSYFNQPDTFEAIYVEDGSEYFASVDGVLFSSDLETLMLYPKAKPGTSYAVPNGTKIIYSNAFSNSALEEIDIADSVTTIYEEAFINCEKLSSVTLSKNTSVIPSSAFYGCNISNIVIPEGVTTIGSSAFSGNPFVRVSLPLSLTEIGYDAFGRYGYDRQITCVYAGTEAMWNNISVESENNTITDNLTFANKLVGNVEYFVRYADNGYHVILTGEGAFGDFASGADAPWYSSTENDYTRDYYSTIESVYVGDGVTHIGANSFTSDYTALTELFFGGTRAQWEQVTIGDGNDALAGVTVYCTDDAYGEVVQESPDGSWTLYDSGTLYVQSVYHINTNYLGYYDATEWDIANISDNIKKVVIAEGVTATGQAFFNGLPNLVCVELPSTITEISQSSFAYCSKLTSVNIPDGVEGVFVDAFKSCSICELTLPSTLRSVGEGAFEANCIYKLDMAEGIEGLYDYSFSTNPIENVVVPDSVTYMTDRTFESDKLKSVHIGKNADIHCGIEGRDANYFGYSKNLEKITVDSENPNLYAQDNVLFDKENNTLLKYAPMKNAQVYVAPAQTTAVQSNAFYGADGLVRVELGSAVTNIGSNAFEGCTSLKTIKLSPALTAIDYNAFQSCKNLEYVVIPDGVTELNSGTFGGCTKLDVVLPATLTSVEYGALSEFGSVYFKGTADAWNALGTGMDAYFLAENSKSIFKDQSYDSGYRYCPDINSIPYDSAVIEAFYNNGVYQNMSACSLEEYIFEKTNYMISYYDYNLAKVMVWESVQSMTPVSSTDTLTK